MTALRWLSSQALAARWMLIDDYTGRLLGVGSGPQPVADTEIDLGGRLVLPGLHDSHLHAYMLGASSVQVTPADGRGWPPMAVDGR